MLTTESRTVFEVTTLGTGGPPVLYLHGEVSVAPDPVAKLLSTQARIVFPTHPGFADAPRPAWLETVRDTADLYVDLIDEQFGVEQFAIVGVSIGGWIGAELALLAPRQVSHLVLVGPAGLLVAEATPADHWFATDEQRAALLFADPGRAPTVGIEEWIANDEMAARLGWAPRFADPTLEHRLPRLHVPTTIIWGAADRLLPPAQAHRWLQALPAARIQTVEGSGHFPNYETPEAVTQIIESALIMQPADS